MSVRYRFSNEEEMKAAVAAISSKQQDLHTHSLAQFENAAQLDLKLQALSAAQGSADLTKRPTGKEPKRTESTTDPSSLKPKHATAGVESFYSSTCAQSFDNAASAFQVFSLISPCI